MKKILHPYVILSSKEDINISIFLLLLIASLFSLFYIAVDVETESTLQQLFIDLRNIGHLKILGYLWGLFILNFLISTYLSKKYVTRKGKADENGNMNDNISWILKTKTGEIKPFNTAIWAKGERFLIKKGDNFCYNPKSYADGVRDFYLLFILPIELNNKEVQIQAQIKWNVNKEFNLEEIATLLLSNNPKEEVLYLDKYLKEKFFDTNKPAYDKLKKVYVKRIKNEISDTKMLEDMLDLLEFPKVFSNANKAEIALAVKKESVVVVTKRTA